MFKSCTVDRMSCSEANPKRPRPIVINGRSRVMLLSTGTPFANDV